MGSNPFVRRILQALRTTSSMVEHLAYNEKVSGSNPLLSTAVEEVAQWLEY